MSRAANPDNGAKIYKAACLPCHGATGEGGEGGGAPLVNGLAHDNMVAVALSGRNNMPGFASSYSPDEINDVTTYILQVLAPRKTGAPSPAPR